MNTISSLVRATEGGTPLEDFLDFKLDRKRSVACTTPSFIADDDDFYVPATVISPRSPQMVVEMDEEPNTTADTTSNTPIGAATVSSAFKMPQAPQHLKMRDMPRETLVLDSLLFNVLRMNVKGHKAALLDLAGPSYVQAICVLHKHIAISRNDRKTRAFAMMNQLQYKGDVSTYQVEAMNCVKEVYDAKCTIMDYILSRVMKSFDGKSKTVQFKIAEQINNAPVSDNLKLMYSI